MSEKQLKIHINIAILRAFTHFSIGIIRNDPIKVDIEYVAPITVKT